MEMLLFVQLLEITTVLLLILVLTMLHRFGGIKYIYNLRVAFIGYFILIVLTMLNLFEEQVIFNELFKYAILAIISMYLYSSISMSSDKRLHLVRFYGIFGILILIPIMLIIIGNSEQLEGTGYVLLGLVFVFVGLYWMKKVLPYLLPSKIVGVTFILFGLHIMNFIIVQYDEEFLILGYMVAAAFEAIITISLVFLNFNYLKVLDDITYKKYINLFNNSSDAILLINNGIIFDCNRRAEEIFERSREDIIGRNPIDISELRQDNGRDSYDYGTELFSSASEGKITRFDWIHTSASGRKINCEISLFLLEGDEFAAIIRDMTANYAYEEEINFHKYYDAVTHLPKRELFIDRLARFLDERYKQVALIAFNIDNFKEINDEYGHEAGDELLCQVANKITSVFKSEITLTRLGGDEFVVIMDKLIHINRIYLPLERIQSVFCNGFEVQGQQVNISVCIGVAFPESETTQPMELLKNSDLALNLAKSKGRGRIEFYSTKEKEVFIARINIERDMRIGIESGEFIPYYQPIIQPHSGKIIGTEVLARWIKKDGSMIYPNTFIPIAEETELISIIGEQILSKACDDFKDLLKDNRDFVIHINLSPLQLKDDSIITILREVMERYEITARHLFIELTETVFIEDAEHANEILKGIRAIGVGVALDDFGTGYSSLSYLAEMQVDTIKIDRSFVVKLPSNHKSRAMMEYLIGLMHDLGYKVVVEGVEEKDQADYLMSIGCDAIQGYYYYRPMTIEKIKKLLNHRNIDID